MQRLRCTFPSVLAGSPCNSLMRTRSFYWIFMQKVLSRETDATPQTTIRPHQGCALLNLSGFSKARLGRDPALKNWHTKQIFTRGKNGRCLLSAAQHRGKCAVEKWPCRSIFLTEHCVMDFRR